MANNISVQKHLPGQSFNGMGCHEKKTILVEHLVKIEDFVLMDLVFANSFSMKSFHLKRVQQIYAISVPHWLCMGFRAMRERLSDFGMNYAYTPKAEVVQG